MSNIRLSNGLTLEYGMVTDGNVVAYCGTCNAPIYEGVEAIEDSHDNLYCDFDCYLVSEVNATGQSLDNYYIEDSSYKGVIL